MTREELIELERERHDLSYRTGQKLTTREWAKALQQELRWPAAAKKAGK